ncbi:ATP-binding cassette domain-containing protein [Saccharothrix obliqua]|uniref:ATP-binding cassette domain-containing protein n=1 Tax=Saccharothrix obliqua TaxID=2861747 RepID=UPI001C5E2354|nr:excinuclease ABC subunit UvrA [Saccharothrix obliqua]MBW4721828.1 excinuclease ABC subunit UvrA [Saccharothrix obliqua]
MYGNIEVRSARENNLQEVSLDLPKRKITVFTGVSGSGKSSLAFGTIAAESQRLINETYPGYVQAVMPRYGRPDVDSLANLSTAVIVDQQRMGGNSRSTVGTATDTYALLRLLFFRAGSPPVDNPKAFSFNDPQGMCPECEGIGRRSALDVDALVDRSKSLQEGAILWPAFAVGTTYWRFFIMSGLFDNDKKLADYTEDEWDALLNLPEKKITVEGPARTSGSFTYEGLLPKFKRLYVSKGADHVQPKLRDAYERVVTTAPCDACDGSRLGPAALACRLNGRSIAECVAMEVEELVEFVRAVDNPTVAPAVASLVARLTELERLGLGYLSLNRETSTLSGGESQRVKMVRHLGSSLVDITYIFDEPTVGLHPHDISRLNELLCHLRDKGNTVLVVEHKPEVMAIADHVVDMGPGAGRKGGQVVFEGTFAELAKSGTLTGRHLSSRQEVKRTPREPTGALTIRNASLHNLHDIDVDIPTGVLTVVTGVAGAGKSTLIRGCLLRKYPEAVFIDDSVSRGSRRSNPATFTGILEPIRKAFATANKVSPALFSANSEGACPECKGLGLIYTDLAHLEQVATVCDTCEGRRFSADVLRHTLRGRDISEVLELSVVDALEFFTEKPVVKALKALDDVGLGYITLWQPVSTMSGGERQRLKLANELGRKSGVYVLDEPTSGLHMHDVDNLIGLFDRLVDNGNTVVVIEHNLDVIARADWVIDVGPGAGHRGGRIVFEGTVAQMADSPDSVTGEFLRRRAELVG